MGDPDPAVNGQTFSEATPARKRRRKPAKILHLSRQPARPVQHMFRTSIDEHNDMVKAVKKGGFANMTDYIRSKLGL